jgi:hypothetical protein
MVERFQKTPCKVQDYKYPKRHGWNLKCSCGLHKKKTGVRNGIEYFTALKLLKQLKAEHQEHDLKIEHSYHAAELPSTYTDQTTAQTHTGDTNWTDVDATNAAIASGNFTTGRKYLLVAQAQVNLGNVTEHVGMRLTHGSTPTAFDGSDMRIEPQSTTSYYTYTWFHVWTAASGEGIKLQFITYNSGQTVTADQITMTAIEISEDITENTDWFFDSRTTNDTLSTTLTATNPQVTFTPNGTDDYLLMVTAQINSNSTAVNYRSFIVDTDGGGNQPACNTTGEDTAEFKMHFIAQYKEAPSNTSHDFEQKSSASSTNGTRDYGAIFALRLNAFDDHVGNWVNILQNDIGTTDFGFESQNETITPSAATDVFVLTYFGQSGVFNNYYKARLVKITDTDIPATQTSDAYQRDMGWGFTMPVANFTQENLSSSTALILDVSSDHALADTWGSTIIAFTLELATTIQFARPSLDQAIGSWEDEGGGTTNIYQSIDEVVASDADFIRSELNPASNSIYEAKLSSVIDPQVATGHIVRYRYEKTGTQVINLIVRLKQGGSTIASATHNGITGTWTAGTFTLSAGEANSITDYTNLRVEFEADVP